MLGCNPTLQHLTGKAFTTECLQGMCRVLSSRLYCIFSLCTLVVLLCCRFVSFCTNDSRGGCPWLRVLDYGWRLPFTSCLGRGS